MPYINLDALDLRIMAALQEDGRLANSDLADVVGLSASPCLRRVRRLEKDGFIRTYRAVLDREAVGLSLTVFADIRLGQPTQDNALALQEALCAMPEVVNCHMLSGAADCLAEIVMPSIKAFEVFLTERLRTLPMIGDIRCNFSLKRVKSDAAIPLTHLQRSDARDSKDLPDCS